MKHLLSTTAIAAALVFGGIGHAGAQAVNPAQPGSASGGLQAQGGTAGSPMGSTGTRNPGMPGGSMSGSSAQSGAQAPGPAGSSSGGSAAQSSAMSEDAIRNVLRARGYSDIEGLERDGDHFKVEGAERYGEDVENLRIDARTGQVRDEKKLSESQVRTMLQDRGYSDVSDVSSDGDAITATAKQNDREMKLRVDRSTGVVTQQQASN
ncbi:PepSY domain-containing protein [Roseomonas sp. AR75]|uniref:PepSY domain-containing protein n=1 Tax=Roseomonas sp. AR75 TaxID=2562311 RepID=UPI0010C0D929|nr:PepSY domain-containing protein [Roseomonas sp. AR75]